MSSLYLQLLAFVLSSIKTLPSVTDDHSLFEIMLGAEPYMPLEVRMKGASIWFRFDFDLLLCFLRVHGRWLARLRPAVAAVVCSEDWGEGTVPRRVERGGGGGACS